MKEARFFDVYENVRSVVKERAGGGARMGFTSDRSETLNNQTGQHR